MSRDTLNSKPFFWGVMLGGSDSPTIHYIRLVVKYIESAMQDTHSGQQKLMSRHSQSPKIMSNASNARGFMLSMVVSGSPKRAFNPPISSIYHLYIAFWGVVCYLPPFRGTRNNH